MRDLSAVPGLVDALAAEGGLRPSVRATLYRNRNFASAPTRDHSVFKIWDAFPGEVKIWDNIWMQSPCYDETSGVLINLQSGANLSLRWDGLDIGTAIRQLDGSALPFTMTLDSRADLHIPYIDVVGYTVVTFDPLVLRVVLYRLTLDMTRVRAHNGNCVASISELAVDVPLGKAYYLSETEIAITHVGQNGVWFSLYDYTGGVWAVNNPKSKHFAFATTDLNIDPTKGWDLTEKRSWTNFATIVKSAGKLYAYCTYEDGSVRGAIYESLAWSDDFVAVPADLSQFLITNAAVDAAGRIHLCGQFRRKLETFGATGYHSVVENLLLWSDNGRTFSLDPYTLFYQGAEIHRWHVLIRPDRLLFVDENAVLDFPPSWATHGTAAESLAISDDILSFTGDTGKEWLLELANGTEKYFDLLASGWLQKGMLVQLELGVQVGEAPAYIDYERCLVTGWTPDYKTTSFYLKVSQEGLRRLEAISYPFYLEISGKQAMYDDFTNRGNFSTANGSHEVTEPFSVDLWGDQSYYEQGGLGPITHSDANVAEIWSGDIKDIHGASTYPEISALPVTVYLIGRSRTGPAESVPEVVSDTAELEAVNDGLWALLEVEHADGTQETLVYGDGTSRWSQYWGTRRNFNEVASPAAGVPFTVPAGGAVVVGDKIIRVGARLKAPSIIAAPENPLPWVSSTYYVSRIEIPAVNMNVPIPASEEDSWEVGDVDPFHTGTTRKGAQVHQKGAPLVLFSAKPYTAFDFELSLTAKVNGANGYVGLVGLAENARNYICGRFGNNTLEILKVRDGKNTVIGNLPLGFLGFLPGDDLVELHFRKHGRLFELELYQNGTYLCTCTAFWGDTDGPLCTVPDIWHVGVYAFISAPYFRITGFDPSVAEGIGILPTCPTSYLAAFPASGTVEIDGVRYTYASKTPNLNPPWGPFQMRTAGSADYTRNGYHYFGNYIDYSDFCYQTNNNPESSKGYLICSSAGQNFIIKNADVDPTVTAGGMTSHLRSRIRHFGDKIPANYSGSISCADRAYKTQGLLGIKVAPGSISTVHGEDSFCFLDNATEIFLFAYSAASGAPDISLADTIDSVCRLAGVSARFPGDLVIGPRTLSGNVLSTVRGAPAAWVSSGSYGGLDLTLNFTGMQWDWVAPWELDVVTDIQVSPGVAGSYVHVFYHQGHVSAQMEIYNGAGTRVAGPVDLYSAYVIRSLRVVYHNQFISIYTHDSWVHTFCLPFVNHFEQSGVRVRSLNTFTINSMVLRELDDWRGDIYVDLETSALNAVNSILQQRPVEIYGYHDGAVSFTYDPAVRPACPLTWLRSHQVDESVNPGVGSEAIVQYSEAGMVYDTQAMAENGFITRLIHIPELDTGALRAASVRLKRARQAQSVYTLVGRLSYALEVGDQATIGYTRPGTGTIIDDACIVESIRFSVGRGKADMTVTGRGCG